jgi:hypothetical protein
MRAFALIVVLLAAHASATADQILVPQAPVSLPGGWSFDGSCASGYGMRLAIDGKASYDEWGQGLWALADKGRRIVLIVEDITEESDRRKTAELVEFRITAGMGNKMSLVRLSDGAKIEAVKCAT